MKTTSSGNYIPALTGLRIVAACLVFFYHFPIPSKRVGVFASQFFSELYIGVTIFFTLSGFLITLRYGDDIRNKSFDFFLYLKKRFARIYPMYFILTTVTFIGYNIDPKSWDYGFHPEAKNGFVVYLLNITFLRGFFNDLALTGIAQGGTLTVEECFYLAAPFILLFRKKINLVFQVVFWYFIGFMFVQLAKNINCFGLFENNKFMLINTFFGRCFDFYVGIQLAIWYEKDKTLLRGGRFTFLGILSIIGVIICLIFTKEKEAQYDLYGPAVLIIKTLILPLSIAVFFKGLLREKTFIRTILESRFFVLLGKSSYAFYLIHMGIVSELLYKYITHNYLLNFPVLLLLAIILYRLIESPLNKMIKNYPLKPALSASLASVKLMKQRKE